MVWWRNSTDNPYGLRLNKVFKSDIPVKLTFLGTGTSTGVPQSRCNCATCRSRDPRDRRMRTSALVEVNGSNILIDCGPDFRQQMLNYHDGDLDALLVTHHHYDHLGGVDDLRPYCLGKPSFPIYCQQQVADDLHRRFPYCFEEHPYPGVPKLDIHIIKPLVPFTACGVEILPLPVNHYILDIVGFRIGPLAYITDAKVVPDETIEALKGVDTLVINALRFKEHPSHINLAQALEIIDKVKPRVSYLTHLSHDMGPTAELIPHLPANVHPACDGEIIVIPE